MPVLFLSGHGDIPTASALLKQGVVTPADVTVSDVADARRQLLSSTYGVSVDTTNAKLYINTNTKASPTWTVVGTQT